MTQQIDRKTLGSINEKELSFMRVVYGVQSTGRGHLARFSALKPLFDSDGHELLVIVSGHDEPPSFFLDSIGDSPCVRMDGFKMEEDGTGGISKRGTVGAFLRNTPGLLASLRRGHKTIQAFEPQLIVSDFDPITGSPMVARSTFKVGIGNQAMARQSSDEQLSGLRFARFNTNLAMRLSTSGIDVLLRCHFYPTTEAALPPILRPDILDARVSNEGHLLVYHSFQGRLGSIETYAHTHPERRIIVYGYTMRPASAPDNITFETDPSRFLHDLATCDTYMGTAGFQAITEAFFLGKRIIVQPIEGHYEQQWNAASLEELEMGRWHRGDLEHDLEYPFNRALHEQLMPWYESGAARCYERIMQLYDAQSV